MGGSSSRRVFPAQYHFVVLVVLLLVPIIATAMILAVGFSVAERTRYQSEALEVSERVIASVDREVRGFVQALDVLAATLPTSPDRSSEALQSRIQEAARALGGTLLLQRGDGVIIAGRSDPAAPDAAALLKDLDARTVRSSGPTISDLIPRTGGSPVIAISVPKPDPEPSRWQITLIVEPKRFSDILTSQNLPADWVAAIVDRNDLILARSRQFERYLGAVATEDLRRNALGDRGVWQGTTKEGMPVLSAYVRSELTGWRVAAGIPTQAVEQPLRQSLFWLSAVGLVGLSASVLVAGVFGRQISRSLTRLAGAATAVGQSTPLHLPAETSIREINLIAASIHNASIELNKRAEARNRAEEALAAANARLERVLDTSPVGIIEISPDGIITFANAAALHIMRRERSEVVGQTVVGQHWGATDLAGHPLSADEMPSIRALQGEVVTGEEMAIAEPETGGRVILSINAVPIVDGERREGALLTLTDTTKRHEVERHQRLLINELNHRVKNTLATVNSIAAQSFRASSDPAAARDAFTGRIVALAQAHDVLTRERWEGADLKDIVAAAVEPHDRARFTVSGVSLRLQPQTSLSVAMALHELATNAVKYGALSVPDGRVAIRWEVRQADDGDHLSFRWEETGGPPVVAPSRRGFGSRLIETGLSRELEGEVRIAFEPAGIVCTIDAPLRAE